MKPLHCFGNIVVREYKETNPKFIIVGIKPSPIRSLPRQYENHIEFADSRNDLLLKSLSFETFKVFRVGKLFSDEETIRSKGILYKKQLAESEERKEYEKLKAKFE